MHARALILTSLCLFAGSCRSNEALTEQEQRHREAWLQDSELSSTRELPESWQTGSARDFAKNLKAWNLPTSLAWSATAQEQLTRVLLLPSDSPQAAQQSVRAALLLSHDSTVPSLTNLLIRLERRLAPMERGRQGVEVVCAGALGKQQDLDPRILQGLQRLATGNAAHPDLDVRVECARAYLAHIPKGEGDKTPIRARACLRFLLKVLRAETPAQAKDAPTWTPTRFVAWPKGRAAQELTLWFPTEIPFRPDGSWQAQMDWADAAQRGLSL